MPYLVLKSVLIVRSSYEDCIFLRSTYMMKSVIFVTFSVLAIVKFARASHLLEINANESIDLNSKQRSIDDVIIQQSVGTKPLEIKPEDLTIFKSHIQLEEIITAERSPDNIKLERSGDYIDLRNESRKVEEKDEEMIEQVQKAGIERLAEEEIAHTDIDSSTQSNDEKDEGAINNIVEENIKRKDNVEESFQIIGHVDTSRNDPDEDKDYEHIIFELEPFQIEAMHRSAASSASNEDSSKIETSRHGRPDILLGGRRVLKSELLKKKLATAAVLSHIGSSRTSPSDKVSLHAKQFEAPMHHPPSHEPSGIHHSPSLHDNTGIYYKDNFLLIPNSQEKLHREYTLDAEANSYPYSPPTSSFVESRSIHPAVRKSQSRHHIPGFYNMFDLNYSPIKNPIFGGGRIKRNAAIATVTPFFKYQLPSEMF